MPSPGGSSRTVTTQELAPEQRQLISLGLPAVEDYINTPLQLYPGSTIAPFDPLQQQGQQSIYNAATGGVQDLTNQSIDTARALTGVGTAGGVAGAENLLDAGQMGSIGLGDILAGYQAGQGGRDFLRSGALLDPNTNPVLGAQSEAAIRPIATQLMENILPGIRSDFVGSNMFGSSRQGIAEGSAIDEFIRQAGDITTNLQSNAFNQGLGAMLSSLNSGESAAAAGVGQGLGAGEAGTGQLFEAALRSLSESPSLASSAFLPGLTLSGLGQQQQQMSQAQLSEEANRFMTEQMLPFLQAQDVMNLAFGIPGGSATTNSTQSPAFDPLGTGLGLMMMAPLLGLGGGPLALLGGLF